jgi:ABC-type sugar transport system substrate-binding protein
MIKAHRLFALGACALVAGTLAACGSSDDDSTSTQAAAGPSTTGAAAAEPFEYGYSIPTGQNPWITAIADAAEAKTEQAGGKQVRTDAGLDPGKAVEQVTRFVTDGVKSIAVAPAQVPQALQGALTKAVDQGINVFALEWSFADDPTAPPTPPVQGQANIDRGKLGVDVAKAVEEGAGGNAKIAYVGLPFPVASVDFFEQSMRKSLSGGSEVVANLDNPTDNAQGALKPLTGAFAANPDINAVVTYNGPSALAAAQAAKAAGLSDKVKIYNIQIDSATAAAVRDGTIEASWDLNPPELGDALGDLINAAATGKPESEWAKTVVVEAPEYTKDNIDTWKDWSKG